MTDHRYASVPFRGWQIHYNASAKNGMYWEAFNMEIGEIRTARKYATLTRKVAK